MTPRLVSTGAVSSPSARIPMEEERIGRDQLIFSRSFSTPITTHAGMRQVMGVYTQQASARLA